MKMTVWWGGGPTVMLVSNLLRVGGGRNDYSVEQSVITAMHENYSNIHFHRR